MSEITYNAAPTCAKFHQSDAFVRGIMGPIGCTDKDTEVLTPQGWIAIGDYNGEDIYQWDKDTQSLSIVICPEYHVYDCDELITFKNKSVSMSLSEGHRMPLFNKDGTLDVRLAKDVEENTGRAYIPIHFNMPGDCNISDDEIRFKVAIEADGHIVANRVVFSLRKERKKERLRGLISALGYDYTEKVYPNRPTESVFSVGYKSEPKGYEWLLKMPSSAMEVVIDEVNYWDGSYSTPEDKFYTTIKRSADIIQIAAHATGRKATMSLVEYPQDNWADMWIVHISKKGSMKSRSRMSRGSLTVGREKTKDGKMYCFTVPTGFFVARKDNCIFITGNSGKSVSCCMEIFRRACEQAPAPDGKRKSRWLVVRNTLPQLETTTIKTWVDWFPPNLFGRMTGKPPYTHHVNYGDVEMEVVFIALDKPEDVKKLLSFECTGIWFNEAREIRKEIIDAGTGRVGRYPSSKDGGCTWSGIIMDTNPPDDGHWWYKLSVEEVPTGWEFFKQPSGMDADGENLENHSQPASEKLTKEEIELIGPERGITKKSEMDLEAKRAVGRRYYLRMMGGKTKEWLNVYVHGNFGYSQSGKAVFGAAWNPELHTIEDDSVDIQAYKDVIVGVDCSGRNPAAVFLQKDQYGCYQALHELVCQDLGATTFAQLLKAEVRKLCPTNNVEFWGDPAGTFKDQDDKTYVEILRGVGIFVRPAGSNRIPERLSAVENALLTMAGAPPKPRLRIHKRCKMLLAGMNGGYRFKQLNVSGEDRFDIKPDKNRFSDVQDGLQYGMLGGGEGNVMKQRKRANRGTISAKVDFNV